MTVVVTGAAGFIGRAVLRHLARTSTPATAVDRRPVVAPAPVRVLTADLLDDDPAVTAALRAATAVIHLAGCPSVRADGADIALRRQRDNIDATARVLSVVAPTVPLVVASSSSVYGGTTSGRPSAEGDPLQPRGGYARSKAEVERLCAEAVAAGARVTTVRPFTVAGEHQRPDMALSRWITAVRAGQPVQVFGSLQRRRDITDVRQVAAALVELAHLGVPGPVNLGTGASVTLAEMLAAVAAAVGRDPRIELVPAAAEEVTATLADTTRLRSLLGWVPVTDLPALVRRQAGRSAAPDRAATPELAAAPA